MSGFILTHIMFATIAGQIEKSRTNFINMKKISKRAHIPDVSGGNGYTHDNGNIAFGNPMDLIEKREFFKKYEQEYRGLKSRTKGV